MKEIKTFFILLIFCGCLNALNAVEPNNGAQSIAIKAIRELSQQLVNYVCGGPNAVSEGNVFEVKNGYSQYGNYSMLQILQKISPNEYLFTINSGLANLSGDEPKPNIFFLRTSTKYISMGNGVVCGNYKCIGRFTYKTRQGFTLSIPAFEELK